MKIKNRNGTEGIIPVFIMMKSVRMDIILAERKSFSDKMLLKNRQDVRVNMQFLS